MMEKVDQHELAEILDSYGINDVFYNTSKWVTPDSMIYIFQTKVASIIFFMQQIILVAMKI